MNNKGKNTVSGWAFFALILLLIVLRSPTLWNPILDVDESILGLFARIWFDGGVPYVDCVEMKPLGIYLFYGLVFSIFGKFNMIAVHLVTMLIVAATAYFIHLMASTIYSSKRSGFLAAFLYIVFGTTYIPKYIATTIEPIMLLPVALQFYFWIKFEREKRSWQAFASGLAFSAACLFKYQAGMDLFILIAYLGIVRPLFIKGIPYRDHWKGFITFLIGAVPLPMAILLYLWQVHALAGFWLWNVAGNIEYISAGAGGISLLNRILTRVLPYMASTMLLWILAGSRIIRLFRKIGPEQKNISDWLILLWFGLSIIPVSTGHRFYGHYFYLLLPSLAILAASSFSDWWFNSSRQLVRILIVLGILLPAIGFTTTRFFIPEINRVFHEDNLQDYKPLADYVKRQTEAGDQVVAWGYAPLVYWYSERMPGTRFFWSDLLVGRTTGFRGEEYKKMKPNKSPEAWNLFMNDIRKHKPVYVIDTSPANLHDYGYFPINDYPMFAKYVQENYKEEIRINNVVFYRRAR